MSEMRSYEQRLGDAKAASEALSQAKSIGQVREVWNSHYVKVGHRVLGRMLLGKTAEEVITNKAEQ